MNKALAILTFLFCWTATAIQAQPLDSLLTITIPGVSIIVHALDSLHGSHIWRPSPWAIANTPHATPADLLSTNPSLFLKQYTPGGLATITLRGTSAGHTQLYWIDTPLNSPMLGQNDLSLGTRSTMGTPRLAYGGASLSDGSGGIGGALYLSPDLAQGAQVLAEYGSFQTARLSARYGWHTKRIINTTALSGTLAQNDFPYQDLSLPGTPITRLPHAATSQYALSNSTTFFARRAGSFTANLYAHTADRELPPTMLTTNLTETQSDQAIRARLGWTLPRRKATLRASLAYLYENLHYQNTQARIDALSAFHRLHLRADYHNTAQVRRIFLRGFGLRLQHDAVQAQALTGIQPSNLVSAYISAQARPTAALNIDLLIRQEYIDRDLSPLLAYLGTNLRLTPSQSLNLNLSRNYRQPTLNDLYWNPGGNPDLLPEKSHAAELTYTAAPKKLTRLHPSFTATAFANLVDGWIMWTPDTTGIWTPQNLNQVFARGTELALAFTSPITYPRWNLTMAPPAWHIAPSYTYTLSTTTRTTDPEDPTLGKQLIYTPAHMFRLTTGITLGHWRFRYTQSITGTRYTATDNSAALPAYTTADLALARTILLGQNYFTLEALATNITNTQYQTIAWRPMPGRAFSVRLTWELNR